MSAEPAPSGSSTTRQRVREVFAGHGFRRLFATRAISQFGDGVFQLAAASVLLFEEPGANPAMDTLTVTALSLIPFSLVGPFTGVFIDRWERHKILTIVPLTRALVAALAPLAALAGDKGIPFVMVVLFVLSSNRFFLATMAAVLPQLVPRDDLLVANSVATTGGSIANVVGLAAGSALAELLGGVGAGAIAALAFGFSALTARRIPVHRGFTPERAPLRDELRQVSHELVAGARLVGRSRRAVYGLSAIGIVQVQVGAMVGILTYYFVATLDLRVGAISGLLGLLALGIFAGILIVPPLARRIPYDRLVPMSFVVGTFAMGFAALHLTRGRVEVATFFVGVSYAFAKIPVDTIVQEEMPDAFRGRAFALYDMLFNVARVTGVALVAFAFESSSDSEAMIGRVAVSAAIAAVVFAVWERGIKMFKRRKPKPARVEDLLLPGELVSVRAYAGGRADEEPRTIVVGGTELPIDAVEWRAVVEDQGLRKRVFVVRVGRHRVRLAVGDDVSGWEIERVMPVPPRTEASGPQEFSNPQV